MELNSCNSSSEDVCVICFKTMTICSIMDCDHVICYECSTRLRVLCGKLECPICRQDTTMAVFSSRGSVLPAERDVRRPEQLRAAESERRYKVSFDGRAAWQAFDALLAHECPHCVGVGVGVGVGARRFGAFDQLRQHVQREHGLFYCDVCVVHLKLFTKERKLYTLELLKQHQSTGDGGGSSYSGHPLCHLCPERFLDKDDLYLHLRRNHYFCHLCEADSQQVFYGAHQELQRHFRREHFLCEEGDCAENKFIVFRTNIDLQAHRTSAHGGGQRRARPMLTLQFSSEPGRRRRVAYSRQETAPVTEHVFDITPVWPAAGRPDGPTQPPDRYRAAHGSGGWSAAAVDDVAFPALSVNVNGRPSARTAVTINVSHRPAAPARVGSASPAAAPAAWAGAGPPPAAAVPVVAAPAQWSRRAGGPTSCRSPGSPASPQPRISQVSSSGNITMQSPTTDQPPLFVGGRLVSDLEAAYPRPGATWSWPAADRERDTDWDTDRDTDRDTDWDTDRDTGTGGVSSSGRTEELAGDGAAVGEGEAADGGCGAEDVRATNGEAAPPGERSLNLLTARLAELPAQLQEELPAVAGCRYVKPDNFESRNGRLVKLARNGLRSEEAFQAFRQMSAEYRNDTISGEHFYCRCMELLGSDSFGQLFSELLVLLPNIQKQTELLSAHDKLNRNGFQRGKLLECPTCGQVLVFPDYARHSALHGQNCDLPPAWRQ